MALERDISPRSSTQSSRHSLFGYCCRRHNRFLYFILIVFALSIGTGLISFYPSPYMDTNIGSKSTLKAYESSGYLIKTKRTNSNGDDLVTVRVGKIGFKVEQAKLFGLLQRNKGWPKEKWDILEDSKCWNVSTTTSRSSVSHNKRIGLDSLTSTTPTTIIRSHYLPEAILIGVQKGGTTALYQYMMKHPNIVPTAKELYFLDEKVDKMILQNYEQTIRLSGEMSTINSTAGTPAILYGIPQYQARQAYSIIMKRSIKYPHLDNTDRMIIDFTPNYVYQSDRLPSRISCIVPWTKLMVLLRNPIDRARSQYDMKIRFANDNKDKKTTRNSRRKTTNPYGNPVPSFQEYIQYDLEALMETGVIQDWSIVDFDTYFDSIAMQDSWRSYMNSGLNAPIGMGLYAIQIQPYLQLSNPILAIQSEKLMTETDETFNQVLDFLDLPRISFGQYPKSNHASNRQKTGIDKKTEELLRSVYEPFNRKLGEMLGKEWENVWD